MIARSLSPFVRRLGRMPTATELRLCGHGALATAVGRFGGFAGWARQLKTTQKRSSVSRGHAHERSEAAFFRRRGARVERQRTKAPFDLLVNGHRVDVKVAKWTDYATTTSGGSPNGHVRGFVFAGLRKGRRCDFFDLICDSGRRVRRFIVPASVARVSTLTITRASLRGTGKYAPFLDQFAVLGVG